MPEKDFIGDIIKYSFSGIIPIDDLYKAIHKWAKIYGYKVIERDNKIAISGDKRDNAYTWTLERKATDYIKYKMDIEIKTKSLKEIKTKSGKKKYYKGEITLSFSTYFDKDYEDVYGKNPLIKFTREVFDKYVSEGKMKGLEREISKDRDKLIAEIRAFLEVQKLKAEEEK